MFCCEVSKIADMIVATTLPDHYIFTVFTWLTQELQQKRRYKALKFLNCEKHIFVKKIQHGYRFLGFVWLSFKGLIN